MKFIVFYDVGMIKMFLITNFIANLSNKFASINARHFINEDGTLAKITITNSCRNGCN